MEGVHGSSKGKQGSRSDWSGKAVKHTRPKKTRIEDIMSSFQKKERVVRFGARRSKVHYFLQLGEG